MRGEFVQILFHLNLHNDGKRPLRLVGVQLTSLDGEGGLLSRVELGEALLRRELRPVAWIVMRDRQSIAAAHRYRGLFRRARGNTIIGVGESTSLTHQLQITRPSVVPHRIRCVVAYDGGKASAELPVRIHRQRAAMTLPVAGRWWVMAGHRFDEYHSMAILSSQNFAYDLGVLGTGQATCDGDPTRNESYHANGKPILAVADGEVVAVHDGVSENTPVGVRPAWQELLRRPLDLAGNHVVVRHGSGEYTAYIHLRPDLKVERGQKVKRGQVLGLCGNSGNSLETHLHFQLQDGPDLLTANGLPVRFGDFTIHLAHLRIYVSADRPMPLPVRLVVEPGRAEGAVDLLKMLP